MRVEKEKAKSARREPQEQEQHEIPEQETPAADAAESTVAGIDSALAEAEITEQRAEEEFREIRSRWFRNLDEKATEGEISTFNAKFAAAGCSISWCCSGPRLDKRKS